MRLTVLKDHPIVIARSCATKWKIRTKLHTEISSSSADKADWEKWLQMESKRALRLSLKSRKVQQKCNWGLVHVNQPNWLWPPKRKSSVSANKKPMLTKWKSVARHPGNPSEEMLCTGLLKAQGLWGQLPKEPKIRLSRTNNREINWCLPHRLRKPPQPIRLSLFQSYLVLNELAKTALESKRPSMISSVWRSRAKAKEWYFRRLLKRASPSSKPSSPSQERSLRFTKAQIVALRLRIALLQL